MSILLTLQTSAQSSYHGSQGLPGLPLIDFLTVPPANAAPGAPPHMPLPAWGTLARSSLFSRPSSGNCSSGKSPSGYTSLILLVAWDHLALSPVGSSRQRLCLTYPCTPSGGQSTWHVLCVGYRVAAPLPDTGSTQVLCIHEPSKAGEFVTNYADYFWSRRSQYS